MLLERVPIPMKESVEGPVAKNGLCVAICREVCTD